MNSSFLSLLIIRAVSLPLGPSSLLHSSSSTATASFRANPCRKSQGGRCNQHRRNIHHHQWSGVCHRSWLQQAEGLQSSYSCGILTGLSHQQGLCPSACWSCWSYSSWKVFPFIYGGIVQHSTSCTNPSLLRISIFIYKDGRLIHRNKVILKSCAVTFRRSYSPC